MFAFRDRLSSRARYRLGFWMCPLMTWLFVAIHVIVFINTGLAALPMLRRTSIWIPLGLELAFWIALNLFAGFVAAFFWVDLRGDKETETRRAFWSVAFACLTLLVWSGGASLLFYYIFFLLFRQGLAAGHTFWESNRSRQFFGDFSDMGDHSP